MPDIFNTNPTQHPLQPEAGQSLDKTPSTPPVTSSVIPPAETHIHALASFCQNPGNISFQTQEVDEEIILFLRRHFITNVPWIVTALFFSLLLIVLFFIFPLINTSNTTIPQSFITVFFIFYYLIVVAYTFISFLTWFYNISFVTNKRVVDIDFSDLVYKNVAATKLNLVQDVSYSQVGVIRSLFDYGDVLVQTAGTIDNFDLLAVPQPERVVSIIENLIGRRPSVG